jgi:hypothetical protein
MKMHQKLKNLTIFSLKNLKDFTGLFSLFFFFLEGGCAWFTSASLPYYTGTSFKIPDGTPIFQRGYKDGCSTVLYARGNDFYRSRYKYRYDPNLIGSAEYRFGHQRGYTFCFQTILAATIGPYKGSGLDAIYPYGSATGAGFEVKYSGNVNSNGFFGGSSDVNAIWATVPADGLNATFGVFQKGTDASGKGGAGATPFGGNLIWSSGTVDQIF